MNRERFEIKVRQALLDLGFSGWRADPTVTFVVNNGFEEGLWEREEEREFVITHWPTEYPRIITQAFGINPQNYRRFGLPGHEGTDFRAPTGSKIFAVAPGIVWQVHTNLAGERPHPYGIHVRINHEGGYQTIYAHLQRASVRAGNMVEAGTVLGLANNTGNSFGSHLHFTLKSEGATEDKVLSAGFLWPYDIIDPTPYLKEFVV